MDEFVPQPVASGTEHLPLFQGFLSSSGMKRFLIAALGCAACLSSGHAMAVPLTDNAAITATGHIPGACYVSGTTITMALVNPTILTGMQESTTFSASTGPTEFAVEPPAMELPNGVSGNNFIGAVYISDLNAAPATGLNLGAVNYASSTPQTITSPFQSSNVRISAEISDLNNDPLPAGEYSIYTTVSCIAQ